MPHLCLNKGQRELENGATAGVGPGRNPSAVRLDNGPADRKPQTAAAAPTLSAADMVGDWAVARGAGRPICVLTLANSPAGDALALSVKPGCDPFVMRFAPSAWRIDEGALVLLSAHGQNWQFEENDAKTWQRVPETADPILLMRQ